MTCEGVHTEINPGDWAWLINEKDDITELIPIWDTSENMEKMDVQRQSIMQKCGCKKTQCNPTKRQCACVKKGDPCTILCKCSGCLNTGEKRVPTPLQEVNDSPAEEKMSSSSSSPSSSEADVISDFDLAALNDLDGMNDLSDLEN